MCVLFVVVVAAVVVVDIVDIVDIVGRRIHIRTIQILLMKTASLGLLEGVGDTTTFWGDVVLDADSNGRADIIVGIRSLFPGW